MEAIKIYLYSYSDGRRNYFFVKDEKIFFKILEEDEEIYYIYYSKEKRIPEHRLIKALINVKKIDLYEFIFSNQINELLLNPKKKMMFENNYVKRKLEELKIYFNNFIACDK